MPIKITPVQMGDREVQRFHLFNEEMSYCMDVSEHKHLLHWYWGKKIYAEELLDHRRSRSSFSPYHRDDSNYSLDVLPQEYPTYGSGDLRTPAFSLTMPDGNIVIEPTYKEYEIIEGKPQLVGLPQTYTLEQNEADTLKITLEDTQAAVEIDLYYTIFKESNVISRRAEIRNVGQQPFFITGAASACIDFEDANYKYLHLHGSWARERHMEIAEIKRGYQGIDSKRGASGVCENPFVALLRENATEDTGDVYGFSLVYSGNFNISMEVEQYGTMRVLAGINPFHFNWKLEAGAVFATPEVVMVYSDCGLTAMSHAYHTLYRTRLTRGKYRNQMRPVLINSWEAAYFDFDEAKLVTMAESAAKLGFDMFVLDDGWFGERDSDTCSLGDWNTNLRKLPNDVSGLAEKINALGLDFGLWVEPEMVSPKSRLYEKHPEWAIAVPGRTPHKSRHQYILDLSREDVCDFLIETFSEIFDGGYIKYVKWDMNRNMSDIYSAALPGDRQGEMMHRYMLGLYRVLEKLTTSFPDILFEGCSGGGGRFDPGMLYYMPQMWASDDTDAVERMYIQYATSVVYPAISVCCHISDVPNHQVGRVTPMELRGNVAMCGSLGCEMDPNKLSQEDRDKIKEQISTYKRIRPLILQGTFYRLMNPFCERSAAWMYVSEDKCSAVVFYYNKLAKPNPEVRKIRLKGLDSQMIYTINGQRYHGSTLMNSGLYLPFDEKDYESIILELS